MAANPGTGIGTTSGMAKNISEVPKELSPIELTIFSTVKSWTSGLLAKMSRKICEVRAFFGEEDFLAQSAKAAAFRRFLPLPTALAVMTGFLIVFWRAALFRTLAPGIKNITGKGS